MDSSVASAHHRCPMPFPMYRDKLVRDLAYSIGALSGTAPLLTLSSNDEWNGASADATWTQLVTGDDTQRWLADLDANPAPLAAHLAAIAGLGRVANYHTSLVQFFLAERVAAAGAGKAAVRYNVRIASRSQTGTASSRLALMTRTKSAMTLHVEPLLTFAIDASSMLPATAAAAEVNDGPPPLSALVSFDLESNLKFRLRVTLRKMELGASLAIRTWAAKALAGEESTRQSSPSLASLARFSGSIFSELPRFSGGTTAPLPPCWWCEDVEELVERRPGSRWAIVDWRHCE